MPFADKLKNDLKQLKEQALQGQVDPALAAQVAGQAAPAEGGATVPSGAEQQSAGASAADPRALALAGQFLG